MTFLFLLAGHFLGDFAFQSTWMAEKKGQSWEINFYHVLVYTASVLALGKLGNYSLTITGLLIIALSHFFIDSLKARYEKIPYLWLDQILHLLILGGVFIFGL
jgi:hypothetical protein